eukprot:SAG31_NODE_995_length_10494_cov_8.173641_5_plen_186_part_00
MYGISMPALFFKNGDGQERFTKFKFRTCPLPVGNLKFGNWHLKSGQNFAQSDRLSFGPRPPHARWRSQANQVDNLVAPQPSIACCPALARPAPPLSRPAPPRDFTYTKKYYGIMGILYQFHYQYPYFKRYLRLTHDTKPYQTYPNANKLISPWTAVLNSLLAKIVNSISQRYPNPNGQAEQASNT